MYGITDKEIKTHKKSIQKVAHSAGILLLKIFFDFVGLHYNKKFLFDLHKEEVTFI